MYGMPQNGRENMKDLLIHTLPRHSTQYQLCFWQRVAAELFFKNDHSILLT
jgi:hypothetical protein